jgi:WD40 repeat protein
MRRFLVVFLIFLIPFTILSKQLDFLQGTWRPGENGYTSITYNCEGKEITQSYAIEINFIKQVRPNEISGNGRFEFRFFEFTALIAKNGLIKISSNLKRLSVFKNFRMKLRKIQDNLVGEIYGNTNCMSNSKVETYYARISLNKKPTNSLFLNLLKKIPINTTPKTIKFFDDKSIVFGTDFGNLGFFNLRNSAKPIEFLNQIPNTITDLVISKKKSKIFVASYAGLNSFKYENTRDFMIKADQSFQPNQRAGIAPFRIDSIDISQDEERILTASDGGTVLKSNDLSFLSNLDKNPSIGLVFVGYYKTDSIVTVNISGFIYFSESKKEFPLSFTSAKTNDYVWSAKLNNQKNLLAIGSKNIDILDVKTRKSVMNFTGHANPVRAMSFSPDGKLLASASEDSFRVWNLKTKKQVWALGNNSGSSVAFSPDGKTLVFGGSSQILVYSVPQN